MAKDTSVRAFKCPSCGAPLEPETGTLTMKCSYCGGTVIIPESLRTPAPQSGPTMGQIFDFGLSGVDMNQIVGNAMHLPQAISLAQQGRLDEAADIYSKITGMEHADAMESVKAMAAGRAVSLTPGRMGANWGTSGVTISPSAQRSAPPFGASSFESSSFTTSTTVTAQPPARAASSRAGRSCGLLLGIVAAAAILIFVVVGGGLAYFTRKGSGAALLPVGFATQKLKFGSEGIGQGLFEDARSLGVDGNGNITVADYQDGRIQTFDPAGKFVSGFSVSANGGKVYLTGMAVSRSGEIYLVHDRKVFIYDGNGTQVGAISDDSHDYNEVIVGGDGKLYAVANEESIIRFKPDYSIDLEIPSTFSTATNNSELETHLAVDGLGNMYVLGSFNYLVLKYSPDGKFINRFGGEAHGAGSDEPGKFTGPRGIAVDGYGRVFVSDFFDIKVFDSDGAYLNSIDVTGGPFDAVFDSGNNLYTITTNKEVLKFAIQKPSPG